MWVFHRLHNKSLKNNKQTTNSGVGGRTNTDLELQTQKSEVGILVFYVCMFMTIVRTQWKSHTATKNTDSYGHRLHCSVSLFLTAWPQVPSSECLTLRFGVSLLTDCSPLSFSSSLAGFRRHNSLCGLWAKIDQERSSGHFGTVSKVPQIRSPLWPPIHKHTKRPTHMHPYIHIYIHINALYCATEPFDHLTVCIYKIWYRGYEDLLLVIWFLRF